VLIYDKNLGTQFLVDEVRRAMSVLRAKHIDFDYLSYGTHGTEEYRACLERTDCLLAFTPSESQGIFLQEAWAMDRPTFAFRITSCAFRGRVIPSTSAPYLTDYTGAFFEEPGELELLLDSMWSEKSVLDPRGWLVENMRDCQSAGRLVKAVNRGNV